MKYTEKKLKSTYYTLSWQVLDGGGCTVWQCCGEYDSVEDAMDAAESGDFDEDLVIVKCERIQMGSKTTRFNWGTV